MAENEQAPDPASLEPTLHARYQVSPLGRWHPVPVLGLAVLNLIVVVMVATAGVGLTVVPAVVVLGGMALAILWFWGFQIATVLVLDGDTIQWASVLRRGTIPVAELTAVRPSRAQFRLVVFERTTGAGQLVLGGATLAPFVATLCQMRPDLPVDLPTLGARARS